MIQARTGNVGQTWMLAKQDTSQEMAKNNIRWLKEPKNRQQ